VTMIDQTGGIEFRMKNCSSVQITSRARERKWNKNEDIYTLYLLNFLGKDSMIEFCFKCKLGLRELSK
jgi:hypothetical protein